MNTYPIPAPGGWGFRPGADLLGRVRSDLPKLPLLHVVGKGSIAPTIITAILQVPGLLNTLTDRELMDAYGIGRSLAYHCRKQAKAIQASTVDEVMHARGATHNA